MQRSSLAQRVLGVVALGAVLLLVATYLTASVPFVARGHAELTPFPGRLVARDGLDPVANLFVSYGLLLGWCAGSLALLGGLPRRRPGLDFGQRIVAVVALGAVFFLAGAYLTTPVPFTGWIAYAPLSSGTVPRALLVARDGLAPSANLFVWFGLVLGWCAGGLTLLGGPSLWRRGEGGVVAAPGDGGPADARRGAVDAAPPATGD